MSIKASDARKKLDFSEEAGKSLTDSKEYRLALDVIDTLSLEEIDAIAKKLAQEASKKEDFKLNEATQKLQEEINQFISSSEKLIKDQSFKAAAERLSQAIEIATKVQMSIVQNKLYYRIANIISTHPEILRSTTSLAGIPSLYLAQRNEVDMIQIFIDRPLLLKFRGVMNWNMSQRPGITLPAQSEKDATFAPTYLQLSRQSSVKSSTALLADKMTDKTEDLNPLKRSPKLQKFE